MGRILSTMYRILEHLPILTSRGRHRYHRFLPTKIDGCVLWLHAGEGVVLSSDDVSDWEDQSGNGNDLTQATADRRPGFNPSDGEIVGLPSVDFEGSAVGKRHKIVSGVLVVAQPFTVCVVAKRDAANPVETGSVMWGGSTVAVPHNSISPLPRVESLGVGATFIRADPSNLATWVVGTNVFNGASSVIWHNGKSVGSGALDADALDLVSLGDYGTHNANGDYFDGHIAEFIIYDRKLKNGERKAVEKYLGRKYGIGVR